MTLERESATYQRELDRLIREGEAGRFALIRDAEIISVWDTYGDAIQAGYDRFGLEPFMVKQILRHERPVVITRFLVPNAIPFGKSDDRGASS
ncbi:MAG TPA: hypothetical protein VMG10_25955 [Gemmataceae bacterium]|nr:hypothetical protein [Gemmataceae bacterium]